MTVDTKWISVLQWYFITSTDTFHRSQDQLSFIVNLNSTEVWSLEKEHVAFA
jgi:hypothetical protein